MTGAGNRDIHEEGVYSVDEHEMDVFDEAYGTDFFDVSDSQ